MSSLVAVLPNKRSAMFLKTHLRGVLSEMSSAPAFMPRFITLERLASLLSDDEIMSDDEQIFLLYDCYRRILRARGLESHIRSFDRFVYWGRIILTDFESIDTSLASATMLYTNLSKEKEISANYLTEEQKEVIRDIWGETSLTLATHEFWNHIPPEDKMKEDGMSYKFLSFWSVLGELYTLFSEEVAKKEMTTKGLQWRKIAAQLKDEMPAGTDRLHFAFIGLSDTTPAQQAVMEALRKRDKASFFWDMSGYFTAMSDTSRRFFPFMEKLAAHFKMPDDFEPETPLKAPEIEVISVGSRIGQTKLVSGLLKKLTKKDEANGSDKSDTSGKQGKTDYSLPDTGIMVPDDSLLSPLMLSVPESIDKLNVTIGLSFRQTPLATLIRSVLAMQLHAVNSHGRRLFRREIVDEIVSHPFLTLCAPEETAALADFIDKYNFFNIEAETLREKAGEIGFVFDDYLVKDDYLHKLVTGLGEALARNIGYGDKHDFEIEILDFLRQSIEGIELLADKYHTAIEPDTRMKMFDSMLSIRTLNMNGSPLQGLQILGLPEARALDFSNLIILSMNEKIFPKRNFIRSLIPEALRVDFGLPPQRIEEQKYAYTFYRAIGRADKVSLIYDSRTGSFGAGERSRFIEQLLRLHPSLMATGTAKMDAGLGKRNEMSVTKATEILQLLESYRSPEGRYLSASSLKNYKACPLKFYLQNVERYNEDTRTEYVSKIDRGNIFHRSLQTIYGGLRDSGEKVDAEKLRAIADDTAYIGKVVLEAINHYRLKGHEAKTFEELTGDNALSYIDASRSIPALMRIEADGLGGSWFKVEDVEKDILTTLPLGDYAINLKMVVDRIDRLPDGSLRFIDYKTGDEKSSAQTIDTLFVRGKTSHDAMFQLMLYSIAANLTGNYTEEIAPVVYCISKLREGPILPLKIAGKQVKSTTPGINGRDGFMNKFTDMINEIFDPEKDFGQTEDEDRCKYCTFLEICGKKSAKEF